MIDGTRSRIGKFASPRLLQQFTCFGEPKLHLACGRAFDGRTANDIFVHNVGNASVVINGKSGIMFLLHIRKVQNPIDLSSMSDGIHGFLAFRDTVESWAR
jgi:hypothetical protein